MFGEQHVVTRDTYFFFFFQAEDGIRDRSPSRGLGDVYKRQLWTKHLKVNPTTSKNWADRDRFVLSAGHGSAMLYSLLHLAGYQVSIDDLKQFRQWDSKTPGHPEVNHTDGVEATTGPLGQGIAMAVGLSLIHI